VRRLQPLLQDRVNKLLERLEGFRDSGEVLMASWAYSAFTNGKFKIRKEEIYLQTG
jgi:hypothetical protein